jgi:hypothetical protein
LTKPISPIVTDKPTETMNSTIPEAKPPSRMLMGSMKKNRRPSGVHGRRVVRQRRCVARV